VLLTSAHARCNVRKSSPPENKAKHFLSHAKASSKRRFTSASCTFSEPAAGDAAAVVEGAAGDAAAAVEGAAADAAAAVDGAAAAAGDAVDAAAEQAKQLTPPAPQ
jgi:hypothetical protein